MSSTEETLDKIETVKQRQRTFQSFSLLSYIGNSLWGILFLILFIACIINGEAMLSEGQDMSRITFYLVASTLIIIACVLCIMGVLRMKKGRKKGFYNYAIGNGLWVLILLYDSTLGHGTYGLLFPVIAAVSIVFIGYFALRLGKLS